MRTKPFAVLKIDIPNSNSSTLNPGVAISFSIEIADKGNTLIIETDNTSLNCYYGEKDNPDIKVRTTSKVFDKIVSGENTLQSTFMTGELTARGDFKILRIFDSLFQFKK